MPRPLVVINVVGLTYDRLGDNTPNIMQLVNDGGFARPMGTVLPAVTCSAQSTILTGELPNKHGIVANGWYFRELSEVFLWRQSNRLVHGERIYDAARKIHPEYTVSKMFWWYNMYADVDWSVTPRPCYPADGSKLFDSYSQPAELKSQLQDRLGVFPLLKFWGPTANIESSRWIARAAVDVFNRYLPHLTLIYLPHLDYNLQRLGPDDPKIARDVQAVDAEVGRITKVAHERNADIVVLSEYGITQVDRPIHINRILRDNGYARVRKEIAGWETLDYGESTAFAVADHQIAHVYIRKESDIAAVAELLRKVDGVEHALDRKQHASFGIDHERSGELVVVSDKRSWFTYYFWLDDALAPDYARTVDIHRKPGYDPVELYFDMATRSTPLDATLICGSHGVSSADDDQQSVIVSNQPDLLQGRSWCDLDLAEMLIAEVCRED